MVGQNLGEQATPAKKLPSWAQKATSSLEIDVFVQEYTRKLKEFEAEFANKYVLPKLDKLKQKQQKNEISLGDKAFIDYDDIYDCLNDEISKKLRFAKPNPANGYGQTQTPSNPRFKIIYSTRTHSQISEFIAEIKKSRFGGKFKVVHLASKSHYCLLDSVKKCGNDLLRNEKCRDARQADAKSKNKCSFY